jgi:hypothetical protein
MGDSATSFRGWLMPKAFCLTGLVVAGLVFLLFTMDLALGLLGLTGMAPFKLADWRMDVIFLIASLILAFLSWSSLRELK